MPASLESLQTTLAALEIAIDQADPQAVALVQTLPEQFQVLIASLSPQQQHPVQPILTEMNRLIQLLQHHILLWQSAKQKRPERAAQVQHDVQQLHQFCQHLSQNLE